MTVLQRKSDEDRAAALRADGLRPVTRRDGTVWWVSAAVEAAMRAEGVVV